MRPCRRATRSWFNVPGARWLSTRIIANWVVELHPGMRLCDYLVHEDPLTGQAGVCIRSAVGQRRFLPHDEEVGGFRPGA